MKSIRISDINNFDSELKAALAECPDNLYVVFFVSNAKNLGSEKPDTDESWCSDCVLADPKIRKCVFNIQDSCLVSCPVGDRDSYKGNSSHPYRVHELIQLKAIPTLIHWTKDGPQKRLVEEECAQDDLLKSFFLD